MKQKAVGFFWTLPIPWTGFTHLPDDVTTAATMSRTIRYQCELIRDYARKQNCPPSAPVAQI